MIPVFPDAKVALKGKKGLVVGIANDQSIALRVCQGIPRSRGGGCGDLSQ
jgi:hypothetical protein